MANILQLNYILNDINYDIILLVDKMEVVGGSAGGKKNRKNITPEELETAGVIFEERKLPVGDFLWIARSKCGSIEFEVALVSHYQLVAYHFGW